MNFPNVNFSLSIFQQCLFAVISLAIVAFGQPAWISWMGVLAGAGGYALFWRVLLAYPSSKHRFLLSTAWFTTVQLIQLSWFISHPYSYIYSVYFLLSLIMGLQFGVIGFCITPHYLQKWRHLLAIAALWTLFEWSRIFILSGYSWNPAGLALSGNIYSLQFASLAGIFGLSFWVMIINLVALRFYLVQKRRDKKITFALWIGAFSIPFIYGLAQLSVNHYFMAHGSSSPPLIFKAVLVQTAFPTEESADPALRKDPVNEVIDQWHQILQISKKYDKQSIDLIVLPEFVVPFGTYAFAYPLSAVKNAFFETFGPDGLKALPATDYPLSIFQKTKRGPDLMVNNAYWVQGLANYFQANVLIGLEDAEDVAPHEREYYSAAMYFTPQDKNWVQACDLQFEVVSSNLSGDAQIANHKPDPNLDMEDHSPPFLYPMRYEKQVLMPMGEYIPFSFCRELAASYGVTGSFTPGKTAKVMRCNQTLFSPSICYEETFSDVMRHGRQKGAELLVNLTSDTWYPNSRLARQHFDHARLRTVENGFPLIRACNTGITGAIDSSGRIIAILGGDQPEAVEWNPDAILVHVPIYTYSTLYSYLGDKLIIAISLLAILFSLGTNRR